MRTMIAVMGVAMALVVLLSSGALAGPTVDDKALNITLALPDGFERMTDFQPAPGVEVPYAFRRAGTGAEEPVCVFIQRLPGPIGRERIPRDRIGKKGIVELYTAGWKSFEVDVIVVRETHEGSAVLTYNAQVPIKPRAIQLMVMGVESDKPQLKALTAQLLGSLDGQTNWLTEEQRYERISDGLAKIVVWTIVIALVTFCLVRRRDRAFLDRALAAGLPMEVAGQKIRPGWIWYLPVGYLLFATLGAPILVSMVCHDIEDRFGYLLGMVGGGILLALGIMIAVMRARGRAKRRILASPARTLSDWVAIAAGATPPVNKDDRPEAP